MSMLSVAAVAATPPLLNRIHSRCVTDPETGCMTWTGSRSSKGLYGTIGTGNRQVEYVHRVVFRESFGHLPEGSIRHESNSVEVHHACGNRLCCNPDHLRAVTRRVHAKLHAQQHCNLREAA